MEILNNEKAKLMYDTIDSPYLKVRLKRRSAMNVVFVTQGRTRKEFLDLAQARKNGGRKRSSKCGWFAVSYTMHCRLKA
jgi:phosphoserine aminotransferase